MTVPPDPTLWQWLKPVLPRVLVPPTLLLALHAMLSLGFNAYEKLPAIDIPMHFAGGIVITFSGAALLAVAIEHGLVIRMHAYLAAFALFSFATTAAVIWEFAEFLVNRYTDLIVHGTLEDTLGDLLMGMLGAIPTSLWCARELPS